MSILVFCEPHAIIFVEHRLFAENPDVTILISGDVTSPVGNLNGANYLAILLDASKQAKPGIGFV